LPYALLTAKEFPAAAPLLQRIYDSGEVADPQGALPVLLAWAELETGRDKDAAPLLRWNPIPVTGTGPLFTFCFPRIFSLRGMAAERAGNHAAAAANYQIFRKLSGPDPLIWDNH
jgi:hypothetical protein